MGAKRALIVDDSKSARAFLSRILEKYDIDVDTAESAEHAIEYLGHHRPDVIFMDHLMPGMDGFQAVQAIKNNPRTAMIPIMMYTSQEGELYLGQARALGAIGVLPKQIKPADVSKVLYQLHLVPDRRTLEQGSFRHVDASPVAANDVSSAAEAPHSSPSLVPASIMPGPVTDAVMREQFADLRRTLIASLETQTDRIAGDIRAAFQEALPPPPPEPVRPQRSWALLAVACAALLGVMLAAASTALWWREANERQVLLSELAALRRQPAVVANRPVRSEPAARQSSEPLLSDEPANLGMSPSPPPRPIVATVPYGADPLGGQRLDAIRQLFDRLVDENFQGRVEIRVFPGRFCLVGNATEGFSLPPDETPFGRCDVTGSLPEDFSLMNRVPVAFANLVGDFRKSTAGEADVIVFPGDPAATIVPYPTVSESLTAGEWNRAGSANNRIEIRLR
jgi:CheY-like chemotaxis protein